MKIGIIGGSGLYDLDGLEDTEHRQVATPFGAPSDAYVCGKLKGRDVCFLPRHGRNHRLLPSEINHKANIFGFKMMGVERVVSVSAVGSLKRKLRPRDIVLPDQYFDRTKGSLRHTFFGEGIVAHIAFGEPTCGELRKELADVANSVIDRCSEDSDIRVHLEGAYVNIEGPAFSTKAESRVYRQLGFDVVGMTSLPEAKLCREAEICYQALAMVTDYDCWHESAGSVTVEMIVEHLKANTFLAKQILVEFILQLREKRVCGCGSALKDAIFTRPEFMPGDVKTKLAPIIGKYVG